MYLPSRVSARVNATFGVQGGVTYERNDTGEIISGVTCSMFSASSAEFVDGSPTPKAHLHGVDFVPKNGDGIVAVDGKRYRVDDVQMDESGMYRLTLQEIA